MNPTRLFNLIMRSVTLWNEARAPTFGASLAYYTAFSLAPLIFLVLGLAALILGPDAARGQLAQELKMTVGATVAHATQEVVDQSNQTPASGPLAVGFSILMLLFGASGVFLELQLALNAIWMVEAKSDRGMWGLVQDRFLSFTMVLGTCFLLLASLLVTAGLAALARFWTPASLSGIWFWQALNGLVSLTVITLLFALLFKYLPDAKVAWQDVWLGAMATAVLFLIGRQLLAVYLGWVATTSTYGAAGSILALLLWVYYTAQIFLFGAAFTRIHAEDRGRNIVPSANASLVS